MHGITSSYALDPAGECVIGLIVRGAMVARRGRERHVFQPGDLCVWDPSARHEGSPHRGANWEARLIVLEFRALDDLMKDPDRASARHTFRQPRVRDDRLAADFLRLHRVLEGRSNALERQTMLLEWIQDLDGLGTRPARKVAASRDPALRRACELLADNPGANVSLDELAAISGASRHRIARLFRAAFGVPPHRFQLAQRLRAARTFLEQGVPVAEVAQRTGFTDQSHLHRHFRRSIGFAPSRYATLVRSNVQDDRGHAR
jgi:AraC-like DNA-binding protein